MPIERLVINASPLILLSKCGLESLLPELFTEILIPNAVWSEIEVGGDIAFDAIRSADWHKRVPVRVLDDVLVWNLGDGESEVLSFAFANGPCAAGIDDKAARNCARTLGIKTLGTGGILVLAKRRGLIESVNQTLIRLQDAGLYISEPVVSLLKDQAGE